MMGQILAKRRPNVVRCVVGRPLISLHPPHLTQSFRAAGSPQSAQDDLEWSSGDRFRDAQES